MILSFLGLPLRAQNRSALIEDVVSYLDQQNETESINFCSQPYEAICGAHKTDQQRAAHRRERIALFNESISLQAARRYLPRLGLSTGASQSDPELLLLISQWTDPHNASSQGKDYSRLRTAVLNEHLSPLFDVLRQETVFIQSLFAQILPREQLSQRVSAVRFRTMSEISQLFAPYPDVRLDLQFAYVGNCGPQGMEQSAYTFGHYRNLVEPLLVVCPGMMVAGLSEAHSTASVFLSTFHSIAHELSHSIDSRFFATDYLNYGSCLAGVLQIPPSFMPEISADVRASQAVAGLLRALDQQMRGQHWGPHHRRSIQVRALKEIYEVYCADKPNDLRHPSGPFRIATILGGNALIRRTMGCGPGAAAVCSL